MIFTLLCVIISRSFATCLSRLLGILESKHFSLEWCRIFILRFSCGFTCTMYQSHRFYQWFQIALSLAWNWLRDKWLDMITISMWLHCQWHDTIRWASVHSTLEQMDIISWKTVLEPERRPVPLIRYVGNVCSRCTASGHHLNSPFQCMLRTRLCYALHA